jgi:chromosome partitioning protein
MESTTVAQEFKTPEVNMKNFITQNDLASCIGVTSQTLGKQLRELEIHTVKFGRTALINHRSTRKLLETRGFKFPNMVIAMQMLKGGSGKTSSTFNIAVRAHQYGFRVLLIDLDMQGNLSGTFNVEGTKHDAIVSYIRDKKDFNSLIIPVEEDLHLIPSNYENSSIDIEIFSKRVDYVTLLSKPISEIRNQYDLILMDCNPSLSTLNVAAALASDIVLVPINPDTYSMEGLIKTSSEITRISDGRSKIPDLKLFYTLFDKREASSRSFLVEYASSFKDQLMESVVHRSADVRTGTISNKSVFEVPRAFVAQSDFDTLTRELLGLTKYFGEHNNG